MTTYTNIPDSDITSGKPTKQETGRALRDNLLAVIEGDATAPKPTSAFFSSISLSPIFTYKGDESDTAVTLSASANFPQHVYNCTNFTINSGITMTMTEPCLLIRCTGTFTLGSGAVINGVGVSDQGGNKGGGLGGNGDGSNFTSTLIKKEPVIDKAIVLSSGSGIHGGGNGETAGKGDVSGTLEVVAHGGAGGGCVIIVANTVNIDATAAINVTGGAGGNNAPAYGGGGGGGIVVVRANTISAPLLTYNLSGGASGGGSATAGASGWLSQEEL